MTHNVSRRTFVKDLATLAAGFSILGETGTFNLLTAANPITDIPASAIDRLAARLGGRLLRPGYREYEAARRVWNAAIDKHPKLIARCKRTSDVVRCIEFAHQHNLSVSIRGGGHHPTGVAISDDGLVIDLSNMKGIQVDSATRRVRVQPGVISRELHMRTQADGLVLPTGTVSTVGVGGLTLGGGEGWLIGKFGLTCDNLLSADVVMADGRVLHANAHQERELFWALRGGGGNFGVVTLFEYHAHPLTEVVAGELVHSLDRAEDAIRMWRDHASTAPDEFSSSIASLVHLPDPVLSIRVCYVGTDADAAKALDPLRKFGKPKDTIGRLPIIKLYTMDDLGSESGFNYYATSLYFRELSDEAVSRFIEHFRSAPSAECVAWLWHLHGAFSRVPQTETAFSHRNANFEFGTLVRWSRPDQGPRHLDWARSYWDVMKPFSTGEVYGNFISETGEDWTKAAYGGNYDRLSAVKRRYDPTNFFRSNINIPPA